MDIIYRERRRGGGNSVVLRADNESLSLQSNWIIQKKPLQSHTDLLADVCISFFSLFSFPSFLCFSLSPFSRAPESSDEKRWKVAVMNIPLNGLFTVKRGMHLLSAGAGISWADIAGMATGIHSFSSGCFCGAWIIYYFLLMKTNCAQYCFNAERDWIPQCTGMEISLLMSFIKSTLSKCYVCVHAMVFHWTWRWEMAHQRCMKTRKMA